MANLSLLGVPISAYTGAGGGGAISVIQDGVKPSSGTSATDGNQWDSYAGGGKTTDWVGLDYGTTSCSFTSVVFQEGGAFGDGGWFSSGTVKVQVRQSGSWVDVSNQNISPSYNANGTTSFETYTFSFDAITGDAIRVFGTPGGSSTFISWNSVRIQRLATAASATHATLPLRRRRR